MRKLMPAMVLLIALSVVLWGVVSAAPDSQRQTVRDLVATKLRVTTGGATFNSATSFNDTVDFVAGVDFEDIVSFEPGSTQTVTGTAFTPLAAFQVITATLEVTPTLAAGSAGDILTLVSGTTNAINLADSGTAKLSAAMAFGQYDSLVLISDGTNWYELSRSDN